MENYHFNLKVKTSAYALYELFTKYGPKILSHEESLEINRAICEIYLHVSLDEMEQFITSLKRLHIVSTTDSKILADNIAFFNDHTSDSPLKSLNNAISEILSGGRINQESIDFILAKMKDRNKPKWRKTKTSISIEDGVLDLFKKEAKTVSKNDLEYDKRRLNIWYSEVLEKGIEEVTKDEVWGDHKLTRDNELKGKRSVRLSFAGRLIYKLDQEIVDDVLVSRLTIVKITSKHDY